MTTVELQYGVVFGKGDGSDWFPWEITLDGAEEAAYLRAKRLWLDPNDCRSCRVFWRMPMRKSKNRKRRR